MAGHILQKIEDKTKSPLYYGHQVENNKQKRLERAQRLTISEKLIIR